MSTERLYLHDAQLTRFDARVVAIIDDAVVLDRTTFYPEGGGQLPDRGTLTLDGVAYVVTDVQIDDAGEVRHRLDRPVEPDAVGRETAGALDVRWRRERMSQHTGQHMLSAALLEGARAETVSSRLGAEASTLDLGVPALVDAALADAEDAVNDAVLEDRVVRVLYPSDEELLRLPLRRAPKVTRDIRLVEIEGFDLSPCGGTHCSRTGQVGMLRIVGSERYKGGVRLTFVTGRHALADYRAKDAVLRELARTFSCGPLAVPAAVGKLRTDLELRTKAHGVSRGELMALLSESLHAAHPPDPAGTTRIALVREGDELGALRALASSLARRPDVVAIVAGREITGELLLVVERGTAARFDAGAWVKQLAAAHGGRGGGRPERAEGRLPARAGGDDRALLEVLRAPPTLPGA